MTTFRPRMIAIFSILSTYIMQYLIAIYFIHIFYGHQNRFMVGFILLEILIRYIDITSVFFTAYLP